MAATVRRVCLWILVVHLKLCLSKVPVSDVFNTVCDSAADCHEDHHPTAICDALEGTLDQSVKNCACDASNGYAKYGDDSCALQMALGQECNPPNAVCATSGAECQSDGSIDVQMRCVCREGMIACVVNGEKRCGAILTTFDDSTCSLCERNAGKCFDVDEDRAKDGCVCPASRSGDNCETLHANVTCTMGSLRVCYLPHPGFNFTADATLYVNGHGDKVQCQGVEADEECGEGYYVITLSLNDDKLKTCGTLKYFYDRHQVRYENMLMVQQHSLAGETDILFKVYCMFNHLVESQFRGLDSFGVEDADVRWKASPGLEFDVLNSLNEPLMEEVQLQPGDKVKFNIAIGSTSSYHALRVESCSFRPSLYEVYSQENIHVIRDSCPAPGQELFTADNTWRPAYTNSNPSKLRTGLVPLPHLRVGQTVFLVCTVKLCVQAMQEQCAPVDCSESPSSSSRKKRAVAPHAADDSRMMEVHKQITLANSADLFADFANSDAFLLVTVCTLLLVLLVIVTALSFMLVTIHRNRKKQASRAWGNRPDPLYLATSGKAVRNGDSSREVRGQCHTVTDNRREAAHHGHDDRPAACHSPQSSSDKLHGRATGEVYGQSDNTNEQLSLQETIVAPTPPPPADTVYSVSGTVPTENYAVLDGRYHRTAPVHAPITKLCSTSVSSAERQNGQNEVIEKSVLPHNGVDVTCAKGFCEQDELEKDSDRFGALYGPMSVTLAAKSPLYAHDQTVQRINPHMTQSVV